MIFFFGSSRSWAAREARRKARLVAKKRRQSIIQATVAIFSLVVFTISMWSLRRMRLSALSIRQNVHGPNNSTKGLAGIVNGTLKTAVSVGTQAKEMPKPPLEPEPPKTGAKLDSASHGMVGKQDAVQEHGTVKTQVNTATAWRKETGAGQRRSEENVSIHESSYDKDSSERRSHRSRGDDRELNANPPVRGMAQEDAGGSDRSDMQHETSRTYYDRSDKVGPGHPFSEEVGKQGVDVLDSEEGGDGLVITMAKKKRHSRAGVTRSEGRESGLHKDPREGSADRHDMRGLGGAGGAVGGHGGPGDAMRMAGQRSGHAQDARESDNVGRAHQAYAEPAAVYRRASDYNTYAREDTTRGTSSVYSGGGVYPNHGAEAAAENRVAGRGREPGFGASKDLYRGDGRGMATGDRRA